MQTINFLAQEEGKIFNVECRIDFQRLYKIRDEIYKAYHGFDSDLSRSIADMFDAHLDEVDILGDMIQKTKKEERYTRLKQVWDKEQRINPNGSELDKSITDMLNCKSYFSPVSYQAKILQKYTDAAWYLFGYPSRAGNYDEYKQMAKFYEQITTDAVKIDSVKAATAEDSSYKRELWDGKDTICFGYIGTEINSLPKVQWFTEIIKKQNDANEQEQGRLLREEPIFGADAANLNRM